MNIEFKVIYTLHIQSQTPVHIRIPALDYQESLVNADHQFIKFFGLNRYATNVILDELNRKEEQGEIISSSHRLDEILKTLIKPKNVIAAEEYKETEELVMSVKVFFAPKKKRCNSCEKITPVFVGAAIGAELLLAGFLHFIQQQYTQGEEGLFRLDPQLNLGLTIPLSLITLATGIGRAFFSNEMIFIKESGANIDRKFHGFWDWLRCKKTAPKIIEKRNEKDCTKKNLAAAVLKPSLVICLLNSLYENIIISLTRILTASRTIGRAKDLIIPGDIYTKLLWVNIIIKNISTPCLFVSALYLGCKGIDVYLNKKFPDQDAEEIVMRTAEELEQAISEREARIKRWQKPEIAISIAEDEKGIPPVEPDSLGDFERPLMQRP